MNGWELAALTVASVVAFDVGFLTTLILTRRHYAKKVRRCRFCELRDAAPDSPWCSAVCADAELGLLGATL